MLANAFVNQTALLGFAGLLVAVSVEDMRRLTIPNFFGIAIVLLYPVHVLTAPTPVDWVGGLTVGGITFVVGFVLYAMRLCGGGDAKFFAAVALWAGPRELVVLIFVTAIVGGIIAAGILVRRWAAASAKFRSPVNLPQRMPGSFHAAFANLLPARTRVGAVASAAVPGPTGDTNGVDPVPDNLRPAGNLPYGVAISAGGLVIAAMLLMRG